SPITIISSSLSITGYSCPFLSNKFLSLISGANITSPSSVIVSDSLTKTVLLNFTEHCLFCKSSEREAKLEKVIKSVIAEIINYIMILYLQLILIELFERLRMSVVLRSEERRVGKECRSRW